MPANSYRRFGYASSTWECSSFRFLIGRRPLNLLTYLLTYERWIELDELPPAVVLILSASSLSIFIQTPIKREETELKNVVIQVFARRADTGTNPRGLEKLTAAAIFQRIHMTAISPRIMRTRKSTSRITEEISPAKKYRP
ncbi:hypothetical protein KM043_012687 [Ampulex compressa]|nr:hypothetical protein KM043_012687 [Ampulex compressa]